ncbi:MAG: glycosyltransferase [bacterium]|nr:glycosyltransferase [bacterium]
MKKRMGEITLLTIYPIDDKGEKIGGIEEIIRSLVKYAPSDFNIEIVGITDNIKVGKWHNITFNGKRIRFFPVLKVVDPNRASIIPLTLRFSLVLFCLKDRIDFRDRIIIFHRLEPAYVLKNIEEKKILFVHGNIKNFQNRYCESRWRNFPKIYFLIEPFFIKDMKKIFVVSEEGTEYYKDRYPEYSDRFEFLPTWYDPKTFYKMEDIDKERILGHYGIPDKGPIILFVGRLELPKDPFLLIESFYLINRTYEDAFLVLVGEGRLKNKVIQKVKELGLLKRVIFLGKKTPFEVSQLINISNLMILSSAFEGMPRIALESLACGLPVVATNVGEIHLIVKDGVSGKLVSSRDPSDLAKAAIEVISSPPSVFSCKKIVSHYSQTKVLPHLYNKIKEIQGDEF